MVDLLFMIVLVCGLLMGFIIGYGYAMRLVARAMWKTDHNYTDLIQKLDERWAGLIIKDELYRLFLEKRNMGRKRRK